MISIICQYLFVLTAILVGKLSSVPSFTHTPTAAKTTAQQYQSARSCNLSWFTELHSRQDEIKALSEENGGEGQKINRSLSANATSLGRVSTIVPFFKLLSHKLLPRLLVHWFYASTRRYIALRVLVI